MPRRLHVIIEEEFDDGRPAEHHDLECDFGLMFLSIKPESVPAAMIVQANPLTGTPPADDDEAVLLINHTVVEAEFMAALAGLVMIGYDSGASPVRMAKTVMHALEAAEAADREARGGLAVNEAARPD